MCIRDRWTDLPHAAFGWLLAGGIIYTIGGVIYALKLPVFNALHKYFGSHEILDVYKRQDSYQYTGSCAGTCHLSRNRRMAQDLSLIHI